MIQKVFYGETNAVTNDAQDISLLSKIALGVIVVAIFVMGVYPKPVFALVNDTVTQMLDIYK
jgi:NADH-quinone oxidoreductase subunit M